MYQTDPLFVVIDLRDVLTDFSQLREQYDLYKRFPLRLIVETILVSSAYEDNGEFLWMQAEKYLTEVFDYIDLTMLDVFFATVTEYLDLTIQRKLPKEVDTYKYVFHSWIDGTTVMLTYDNCAQSLRGTQATYFC